VLKTNKIYEIENVNTGRYDTHTHTQALSHSHTDAHTYSQ